MRLRDLIFVSLVVGGGLALARGVMRPSASAVVPHPAGSDTAHAALRPVVAELDAGFRKRWAEKGIQPAGPAPELAVLRRFSMALVGSVPSLEEIRQFEARPADDRLDSWLEGLLHDRRTADNLAERFARSLVGTEDGPFLLFRRRRFTTWLSDAILANRPYDAVVRDLVADQGLWTDHPATNFVSVTFNPENERPDPERLAARVARAFLGVRLDCAQCHDHPFQPWKQADFRGLAAYFGGVYSGLRGIRDRESTYLPADRKTKENVKVEPRVPFRPELLPADGSPREQLAGWLVNPANPSLARATVNRVWALLLGRPLVEPVDDLPVSEGLPPTLELLARDLSSHGYDLHRLIRLITATEVFRLDSTEVSPSASDPQRDETWSAFPLTRLRPDQVAGSVFQSASLPSLGPQSPWYVRFATYTDAMNLSAAMETPARMSLPRAAERFPSALLLMNGDIVTEKTRDGLFNASRRIAELAPEDRQAVEVAYLTVLTRRPTADEMAHFQSRLEGTKGQERKERLTDLFWTLLNSTEFSWNH